MPKKTNKSYRAPKTLLRSERKKRKLRKPKKLSWIPDCWICVCALEAVETNGTKLNALRRRHGIRSVCRKHKHFALPDGSIVTDLQVSPGKPLDAKAKFTVKIKGLHD